MFDRVKKLRKESKKDIATAERPVRDYLEKNVDKSPRGPLGYSGKGNIIGGSSYFVTSFINKFNPVAGTNVGYRLISHSVDRTDHEEIHTFVIDSWFKETSRFASKLKAPPSIVDFFRESTDILSVEPITKRRTSTTWRVKVRVKPRRHITE